MVAGEIPAQGGSCFPPPHETPPQSPVPAGNRVRTWTDEDYAVFCAWWDAHGVPRVPRVQLPACGLVVERDGIPVLVAWLYQDNSCGVAWLGWFLKNPAIHARETASHLRVLLGAADEVARSQGRHSIIVMTDKSGIGRALTRHGYIAGHPATEYWRIV
ncbi:hypothetical protein OpiT1DRAFT_05415 [Opitutaceae bacterium TAV1]|nr:hypothetical protein OpiT1DRAFT_05415 [Opitutaceae bacterium TAV1]